METSLHPPPHFNPCILIGQATKNIKSMRVLKNESLPQKNVYLESQNHVFPEAIYVYSSIGAQNAPTYPGRIISGKLSNGRSCPKLKSCSLHTSLPWHFDGGQASSLCLQSLAIDPSHHVSQSAEDLSSLPRLLLTPCTWEGFWESPMDCVEYPPVGR